MDKIFLLLLLVVVLAFIALTVFSLRRLRGAWRLAALVPAAVFVIVIANIVIGTSLDRTSHNLWPLELVAWSVGGLVYFGVLFLIRRFVGKE